MAKRDRSVLLLFCVCSSAATLCLWIKRFIRPLPDRESKRMGSVHQTSGSHQKMRIRGKSPTGTSEGEELRFRPIGHIQSCFPNRRGTPRQGFFTPSTRATLSLRPGLAPYALEGIQAYSHVWVTFVFHANTRSRKKSGAVKNTQNVRQRTRLKIQPPKYDRRVGVFSTRAPHRPNPIGQTVVRLDSVDLPGGQLHFSGIDFVDGTPVLDVKPYVPYYDCIPLATVPRWVSDAGNTDSVEVQWSPLASSQIDDTILSRMRFYSTKQEVVQVIEEVLQQNMRSGAARSRRQRRRHGRGGSDGRYTLKTDQSFCFSFDRLDFKCTERTQDTGEVRRIVVESVVTSRV